MAKTQLKDLEEAGRMVALYEEMYSGDKDNPLMSAKALLPLVAAIKLLISDVRKLQSKSN